VSEPAVETRILRRREFGEGWRGWDWLYVLLALLGCWNKGCFRGVLWDLLGFWSELLLEQRKKYILGFISAWCGLNEKGAITYALHAT
jgi:hypothetical protein